MDVTRLAAALVEVSLRRASGTTEAAMRAAIGRGDLVSLRPGWCVDRAVWAAATPEERHVLRVLATARVSPDAVFSHVSAAALHGWPLTRTDLDIVHVTAPGGNGVVTAATTVARHDIPVPDADRGALAGIACTSPDRTVWDILRTESVETGLSVADAALRAEAGGRRERSYDQARAARWRERMRRRSALAPGARGVRAARFVIGFADGRAQLPAESISRLYLHRLGFDTIRLQVPVRGPRGEHWEVNLALDDVPALAEVDGAGKYLRAALTRGQDAAEVVMAEKRRENAIRAIVGIPMVRWGWAELASPETLRTHLASFHIHARRPAAPPRPLP